MRSDYYEIVLNPSHSLTEPEATVPLYLQYRNDVSAIRCDGYWRKPLLGRDVTIRNKLYQWHLVTLIKRHKLSATQSTRGYLNKDNGNKFYTVYTLPAYTWLYTSAILSTVFPRLNTRVYISFRRSLSPAFIRKDNNRENYVRTTYPAFIRGLVFNRDIAIGGYSNPALNRGNMVHSSKLWGELPMI